MTFEKDGNLFEINKELIDVTPIQEPDPNWKCKCRCGLVHTWESYEKNNSFKWIVDVPATDEYPTQGHYECTTCGDEITDPGMRPPQGRKIMTGRVEYLIDGKQVSEDQFKKEAGMS